MSTQHEYRLALDINTSAIGTVTYRLNENKQPYKLEHLDVRVFSEPLADAQTGKLKKTLRREKRLIRRQVGRRAQRMKKIAHLFLLVGLSSDAVRKVQEKQGNGTVHKWRSDAVTQEISLEELMAVFLLMAKNRGYEGRFIKAEDGEFAKCVATIKDLMQKYGSDTLGQVFYKQKIDPANATKSWKKISVRGTYAQRDMLTHEFSKIWERQEKHHKVLKNISTDDERIREVYERYFEDESVQSILPRKNKGDGICLRDLFYFALFDQRPIWWKKDSIGKCELEQGEYRASRAHPVFQEYRIEQLLNDLELKKAEAKLNMQDKEKIRPLFHMQKEVSANRLYKELGIEDDRFTHDRGEQEDEQKEIISKDHKFKGNATRCELKKLEKDAELQLSCRARELFIEIIANIDEPSFFGYENWHERKEVFEYFDTNTPTENQSVIAFINVLFKKDKIQTLKTMKLDTGRADYSVKAMKKLLPHMKEGMRPDEARDEEYPDWRKTRHDNLSRVGDSVVQQALNETKKAIRYAIKKHKGKLPKQVVIELSRDMKLSQEKRRFVEGVQIAKRRARDAAWKELADIGENPSQQMCKKYILWQEQKGHCAYCGKYLEKSYLRENTEIDHIVPKAYGGQNNHANLAVICQTCSQIKGKRLPMEAFAGTENENAIKCMSEKMKKPSHLTKSFKAYYKDVVKRAFLLLRENKDDFEGCFRLRQNSETAWIGRELNSYLKQRFNINKTDKGTLEDRVYITRGTITAYLRRKCGLDTLIPDLRKEEGKPVFNRKGVIMNDKGECLHGCGEWHGSLAEDTDKRHGLHQCPCGAWRTPFLDVEENYDKRTDHRHHAVDAAIIGLVDRGTFIKAAKYYKDEKNHKESKYGKKYPTLDGFEKDIVLQDTLRPMLKTRLLNYIVWHKPDRSPIENFFDENIYSSKGSTLKLKEAKKLSELAADTFEATKKNLKEYIEGTQDTQCIIKQFTDAYAKGTGKIEKAKCKKALSMVERNINKLIKRKTLTELVGKTFEATSKTLELIVGENAKKHIIAEFTRRYNKSAEGNEETRCKNALCGASIDDGIFYPANTKNKVKCVRVYHKVTADVGWYKEEFDKRIIVRDACKREHSHILNNAGYACFEIVHDKKGNLTYKPITYHHYWMKDYQEKLKNDDGIMRIYKNDIVYDCQSKKYYVVKQLCASSRTVRCVRTTETMSYADVKTKAKHLMKDFGKTRINDIQVIKSRSELVDSMSTHEPSSDYST